MHWQFWKKGRGDKDTLIKELLANRETHIVHLTHNDLDAAGADAIHRMKYGEVLTLFSSVGRFSRHLDLIAPNSGNGDVLSISDIGYQRGCETSLRRIHAAGWRIEWRDHHRWNSEEERAVTDLVDHLTVDPSVCATGICARELLPGDEKAASVARVVCDYDLWKNEDPRSRVLGLILQHHANRDYVRDCLIRGVFIDPHIEREHRRIRRDMERAMKWSLRRATVQEGKYRVVFAPMSGYPTETAAYLREKLHSEIEVVISPNGRFSIRSIPPISHLIAREFGGGGHPNAAGASFDFSLRDRVLFRLLARSPQFSELYRVAEQICE